jgi:hypothetical protein
MEAADVNEWMPCSNLKRRSPAKTKKRMKLRTVNFRRVFTRGLGIAIILILAIVVVRKTVRPFALCYGEASSAGELSRELHKIQNENNLLSQKRTYLVSREGALTEARKLGWVMRGERGIVIANGPTADQSTLPPARRDEGLVKRIKDKLRM